MLVPCGLITDRFGPRLALGYSTLIIGLAGLMMAFSKTILDVDLARMAIGAASGFSFVGSTKALQKWFPSHRFASLFGLCLAFGNLGLMSTAPFQMMSSRWGWQVMLMLLGVISSILGVLILLLLHDSQVPQFMARLTPSMGEEVCQQPTQPRHGRKPRLIQFALLAVVATAVSAPILTFGSTYATSLIVVKYGLSLVAASEITSALFLGVILGSLSWGWLSDRLGRRKSLQSIGATGLALLLAVLLYGPAMPLALFVLLLFGIGFLGMSGYLSFTTAKELFPVSSSLAVGSMSSMASLGFALILQLVAQNLQSITPAGVGNSSTLLTADQLAQGLLPVLLVVILIGIPASFLCREPLIFMPRNCLPSPA